MKLATWNVNSLKVRQQHVIDWLELSQTDVLCLQELKLPDEKFPRAELEEKGYRSWFAGQKTYNGVGILVRDGMSVDEGSVMRNIPGFEDPQQRVIAATIEGVRVICAYFPNGQAPGTDKFAYKAALARRAARLDRQRTCAASEARAARRLQHRTRRPRRA